MPEETQALTRRIVELESHLMLLERELEQLNEVVLQQQSLLKLLQQRLDHWELHLGPTPENEDGPPHLEKPPHY